MKKMYIAPAVEINETMASQMMALSLQGGAADKDQPILVEEDMNLDIWAN